MYMPVLLALAVTTALVHASSPKSSVIKSEYISSLRKFDDTLHELRKADRFDIPKLLLHHFADPIELRGISEEQELRLVMQQYYEHLKKYVTETGFKYKEFMTRSQRLEAMMHYIHDWSKTLNLSKVVSDQQTHVSRVFRAMQECGKVLETSPGESINDYFHKAAAQLGVHGLSLMDSYGRLMKVDIGCEERLLRYKKVLYFLWGLFDDTKVEFTEWDMIETEFRHSKEIFDELIKQL